MSLPVDSACRDGALISENFCIFKPSMAPSWALVLLTCVVRFTFALAADASKPNVLVIMADDQGKPDHTLNAASKVADCLETW